MTTLYLGWQDQLENKLFPVGRLDTYEHAGRPVYEFAYVNGVRDAFENANFAPIPGFGDVSQRYRSSELFPLFFNRVMNLRRPDRPEYLRRLGLDTDTDAVSELAVSGGLRHTDSFAVFPEISPDKDGHFMCRIALQGSPQAGNCEIPSADEPLELNRRTGEVSYNGHPLGALPFGLVDILHKNGDWLPESEAVTITQMNPNAPINSRVLVDFSGRLPAGFRPMEHLPQYQPIAPTADYPTNRSSGRKADTT